MNSFFLSFFLFPLFFLPLTQRILFFFLVPISFHFLLISFSHSFLLIFSFLLTIYLLLRIAIDRIGPRRKLPPPFLHATCLILIFLDFFVIILFLFITSHTHVAHCEPFLSTSHPMWLIVSHSFQVHHMALAMCHL